MDAAMKAFENDVDEFRQRILVQPQFRQDLARSPPSIRDWDLLIDKVDLDGQLQDGDHAARGVRHPVRRWRGDSEWHRR